MKALIVARKDRCIDGASSRMLVWLISSALVWFIGVPIAARSQAIITTIAGSGRALPSSGVQATNISFGTISGIAVDPSGNVFIADQTAHVVYKVTQDGKASIFSGTGTRGFSGDGGPATMAQLDGPRGLGIGLDGSLYITDGNNQRIRKVDPSGTITSVAGGSRSLNNWTLYEGAPASNVGFDGYEVPAVDANGNFYFAGFSNIWKVSSRGLVSRVAGNGSSGFSGDGGAALKASLGFIAGIALDANGNIYLSDSSNLRIRKIGSDGVITTIAGNGTQGYDGDGGPATAAQLGYPTGIAVDSSGNLYICESRAGRLRIVGRDGIIRTIVGAGKWSRPGNYGDGGLAVSAELGFAAAVAIDREGNIYIADESSARVRKVNPQGVISTFAGSAQSNFAGDGGPAIEARFDSPTDLAFDRMGNLLVADYGNNRIRKITPEGTITTIAGNGIRGSSGLGGFAIEANLDGPIAVAADDFGNVFISETSRRILKVDASGRISQIAWRNGGGGSIAVDKDANLYVANPYDIQRLTPSGDQTTIAGIGEPGYSGDGGPAIKAKIWGPSALTFDRAGRLYFTDSQNHGVRRVDLDGTIQTVAGNGRSGQPHPSQEGNNALAMGFEYASGIAVDNENNMYIAGLASIFRINPEGFVTYLLYEAVDPMLKAGFSGDGGPARSALFGNSIPSATGHFITDFNGNLFLADTANDRIRKIAGINSPQVLGASTHYFDFPDSSGNLSGTVEIKNLGSGVLNWRASVSTNLGGNWLSVNPTSGTAPSVVTIAADSSAMPPGVYSGKVIITSDKSTSSPWTILITLTVPGSFPHIVIGGGYTTTLSIHNPSTTYADGTLAFFDKAGNPMDVSLMDLANDQEATEGNLNSSTLGSSFRLGIHSGASKILSIGPINKSQDTKVGWVHATYGNPLMNASVPNGTAIYNLKDGTALKTFVGVMAAQQTKVATIPIDNNSAENRGTAFAIANPGKGDINIRVIVVDERGEIADDFRPPQLNPLESGKQVSIYLHELLPSRTTFRGSFVLSSDSDSGFIATALIEDRGRFTSIPVIPRASSKILWPPSPSQNSSPTAASVFPQIAVGGGWTTSVVLVNTGNTTENGNLALSGPDGIPFKAFFTTSTTDFWGRQTTVSRFDTSMEISIPAGGTSFIAITPANANDPVQGGWAQVHGSDGDLAGVATFQYSSGNNLKTIAGVLGAERMTSATLPIFDDNENGRWTGYAIANPGDSRITVRAIAVKTDGTIAARLSPIVLDPGNRTAAFFGQDPMLGPSFRGSIVLVGEKGAMFNAIAVIQEQGEDGPIYTSIPVIAGKALGIE